MQEERYLWISAYVRALEGQRLAGADLNRMIDAATPEDSLRVLADRGYPLLRPDMTAVERALRESREELLSALSSSLPDNAILDLFRIPYDYHNVKVALKALWARLDGTHLLMGGGRLEPRALYHALQTGEESHLPEPLLSAAHKARETVDATGDPQKGDLILDRACFAEQLFLARRADISFLTDYVRLLIDRTNLQAAVRVLRMGKDISLLTDALIPGGTVAPDAILESARTGDLTGPWVTSLLEEAAVLGQTATAGGSLTAFETACDARLARYLQRAALIPFGPEPVLAFLAANEREQQIICIIVSGKLARLPADTIRERLGGAYG